jgi:hypothetical protein
MIRNLCRVEVSMKPIVHPCLILSGLLALAAPVSSAEAPIDYNRDVRPILAKNCFACHGQDDGHRAAKLRLDRRETAIRPRKRGAAIVAGAATKSLLVQRVTAADRQRADGGADCHPQTLDRPGRGICRTLGIRQTEAFAATRGEGSGLAAQRRRFLRPD